MSAPASFRATGVAIADRILDGTSSAPVRVAAARGALPVPRDALLSVLVYLLADADPAIRDTARRTIDSIPEPELAKHLSDPQADPAVLDFFATSASVSAEALAAAIANRSLADETVLSIARSSSSAGIDLLLLNQERLLRTPEAVEALRTNEALSLDQRRRFLDFAEHVASPAARPEPSRAEPLPPELLGPVSEEELRAMLGQMGDLSFINLEVGELIAGGTLILDPEVEAELGTSFETVYKQILRMNPAQRLRAALRGGREARAILVRDTNRIVASAVMRNPRITEEEVVGFAAQKGLSEDVLRMIGTSRTWTGSYTVILNLVKNPKTPSAIAMNHTGRLHTRELRNICRDKNIPEVIRRMARRVADQREVKPRGVKKH